MNTQTNTEATNSEWAKGWQIILASLIGIALCLSPVPYWALIIIGPELGKEFGWSRQVSSAGFLFMTAGVLVGAPIAGQLVDKFGARKVLLPSIFALSVGTCAFALMTANPATLYTIFFFTAFLGAATLPITWTKAIVNNFDKHRGIALGIALTGTGVTGFLAPPYLHACIEQFGWRGAYIAVGILPLIISLPLAFFLFRDRKEEAALATGEKQGRHAGIYIKGCALALALFALITWVITAFGPIWGVALMRLFLAGYVLFV